MRLFVAIQFNAQVRSELEATVARLKPQFAGLRWSAPESWHITLQFLGNTSTDQLQFLIAQLRTIQAPAVPVRPGNLSAFDRAGVFAVNVAVSPELLALRQSVVPQPGPVASSLNPAPIIRTSRSPVPKTKPTNAISRTFAIYSPIHLDFPDSPRANSFFAKAFSRRPVPGTRSASSSPCPKGTPSTPACDRAHIAVRTSRLKLPQTFVCRV